MVQTLKKASYIILISLGLAFIFNFLFFAKEPGISVFIFSTVLLGVVFLFGLHQQVSFKKTWWLALPILFFALMPAVRANEFLAFTSVCAVFGLLMLLAQGLVGKPVFLMKLADYIILMIVVPFRMLSRALATVSMLGQIQSKVKERDLALRIIKGVIMAVPILIIFGLLFSQADLAFSQFLKGIVDINISERTVQYMALLAFSFLAGLCFLSYIFFPKEASELEGIENTKIPKPGRTTEVLVFLGLIASLFLLFIGFQIAYLFGGEANIVNAGFTYAEYARRGFFELLAVGVLSLFVLVASEKYAGVEGFRNKQFQIPALILITQVFVVMASAFKRLLLYIDAYSLTELRFFGGAFILLLFVLFVLLAIKFVMAKKEEFLTFGALLAVIAFFAVINIVNPDAFIARANLEQFARTGKIDVLNTGQLSADAVAQQLELYNKLEGQDKISLTELLQKQKDRLQSQTKYWQSANFSRTHALELLQGL